MALGIIGSKAEEVGERGVERGVCRVEMKIEMCEWGLVLAFG